MNTTNNTHYLIAILFAIYSLSDVLRLVAEEASFDHSIVIRVTKSGGFAYVRQIYIFTNKPDQIQREENHVKLFTFKTEHAGSILALIQAIENAPNVGNEDYEDLFKYDILITYNNKVITKSFYELPGNNIHVTKYLEFIEGCIKICSIQDHTTKPPNPGE